MHSIIFETVDKSGFPGSWTGQSSVLLSGNVTCCPFVYFFFVDIFNGHVKETSRQGRPNNLHSTHKSQTLMSLKHNRKKILKHVFPHMFKFFLLLKVFIYVSVNWEIWRNFLIASHKSPWKCLNIFQWIGGSWACSQTSDDGWLTDDGVDVEVYRWF